MPLHSTYIVLAALIASFYAMLSVPGRKREMRLRDSSSIFGFFFCLLPDRAFPNLRATKIAALHFRTTINSSLSPGRRRVSLPISAKMSGRVLLSSHFPFSFLSFLLSIFCHLFFLSTGIGDQPGTYFLSFFFFFPSFLLFFLRVHSLLTAFICFAYSPFQLHSSAACMFPHGAIYLRLTFVPLIR